MPQIVKVIGNPGTGKTKYLVDRTASLINEGIPADEIAYLTFTKKAAQEAMERLVALTGETKELFKWVRTLHSLAFYTLGVNKDQMVSDADIAMILGIVGTADDLEGKQIQQMHSYAHIAGLPMIEAWERMQGSYPVPWTKLLEYDKVYTQFKEHMARYDFYDLLEKYIETPVIPKLHTVIVDEAQDISPVQWSIIQLLSAKATCLLLAGDPHQAIYQWCGADAGILTSLPGAEVILPKSNRIPKVVQDVAHKVLSKFTDPDKYPYEPADHAGKVILIPQLVFSKLPLETGTWMFLARNETFLTDVRTYLHNAGYAFESRGSATWSHYSDQKMLRHIEWYDNWVATGEITAGRQAKLKDFCSHPERCAAMNLPWQEAFDALPAKDKRFYASYKRGESGRIILSTIHGSKGGEADNVVLFGDFTKAVDKQFKTHPAQEYACLYVGITRAKKNLFLVQPERQLGYNWREFL